jgi:hypothetical protein
MLGDTQMLLYHRGHTCYVTGIIQSNAFLKAGSATRLRRINAAASDSPFLGVTGESCLRNPRREICTVGSVREEIPVVPWWT